MVVVTRAQCAKRQRCACEQTVDVTCAQSQESESIELESDLELEPERDFLDELIRPQPKWYIKIHKRFPHLTFEEAAALAKCIYAAPGYTITGHSGDFTGIERPKGGGHKQSEMAWSCCHGVVKGYASYCPPGTCYRDGILTASLWGMPTCKESPDRMKRDPCGQCDKSITFSLEASDFR